MRMRGMVIDKLPGARCIKIAGTFPMNTADARVGGSKTFDTVTRDDGDA